ncbi:membrane protein [Spirochaetia bacterium]|nr:membrane protein [Spirochaetia bacterium]
MTNFFYTLIIYPIVEIIELVFVFSQKVFKAPGISVLAIGAAISILTLPLYAVAEKWQQLERDTQKRLAPGIAKIKAVFKGDEQYMILSTYYRQNHYHPIFTLRSTFGLLIQIPFFIAAYSYLSHLEALQGASFFLIKDLGAPDALIPFRNGGINALPIIMTAINIIAGAIYTRGFPLKDKIQLYGMALIFLVLLYNSPAGLVVYWTLNNIFSLLKNLYYAIPSKHKAKILLASLSVGCIFMIYYLLAIHKGNIKVRANLSVLFGMIGLIPFALPLLRRFAEKLPRITAGPRETFIRFILAFGALWLLTGVFLPSMLIASSPQEFSFLDSYTSPVFFVGNTALQAAGLFLFWPFCLFFLFSEKVKKTFAIAGFILCISALCNCFLFPGNYGLISINLIFDENVSHPWNESLMNALVIIAVSIAAAFLFFIRRAYRIIPAVIVMVLISLGGLSLVNIIGIQKEFKKLQTSWQGGNEEITVLEPIFQLSKTGKNIIVFMLDRAMSIFVPYILEESPDLAEEFSGFVYYPNTVSFNGYTRIGSPPIFGGYEYTPLEMMKRGDVPMVDKHNEALLMMPRIFADAGYEVTAADQPYQNYSQKPDHSIYAPYPEITPRTTDSQYTNIWIKEHGIPLPSESGILKRNILWYSLFRVSPLAFRQGIYLLGDWCSPLLGQKLLLTLKGYAELDYLSELTGFDAKKENVALIMNNNTTHEPSLLQAPEYRPVLTVTNYGEGRFKKEAAYHTNMAAWKRIAEWFDLLKAENVYDNTRIILVADHGASQNFLGRQHGIPFDIEQFNPLLLVKDFYAGGSLKTDDTFMSNADVPAIAFAGLIENPVNPFTGNPVNMDMKKEPLYISVTGSIHVVEDDKNVVDVQGDYYVHGDDIYDPVNWSRAGK